MENSSSSRSAPGEGLSELSFSQRALVVLYIGVAAWYLSWRPTSLNPDAMLFSTLIYAAEVFGFACALLYLFMCWSLKKIIGE